MNEERAREAVEHLQVAALQLISAARAALDVAEDLVKDPAEVVDMVAALATVIGAAREPRRPPTAEANESPEPGRVVRIAVD